MRTEAVRVKFIVKEFQKKMKRFTAAFLALILTFGSLCLPQDLFEGLFISAGAYEVYGDYQYTVLSDGTVEINKYNGSASILDIPGSIEGRRVTSVGYRAFYNCTSLTKITIPDSVTSIGNHAFFNCTSLTDITIPDSITSIGNYAFNYCTSLTEITIPNSVTSIGNHAFFNCTSLTEITIPDSITSIGDSAFSSCTSLAEITIPDSVTSIGDYAFNNCTSLTEITIPDSVTSIGNDAFWNCTSLTKITIPDSVTSIEDWAFNNCTSLTEITIPDSVTSIGYRAFSYCTSLTEITIPDSVTSIGNYAFSSCTSLTKITIPDSVTSIGDWAFSNCTSLTEITIPNSVTSIGNNAFWNCPNLTIICEKDSCAHTYAKDNNISYRLTNPDEQDDLTITLDKTSYLYTGREIKPGVTVMNGDAKLKENTDYTLSYRDNINIGTGSVTVKFKGDYKSKKTLKFKITDVEAPEKPEKKKSIYFSVIDENGNSVSNFTYTYNSEKKTASMKILIDDAKSSDTLSISKSGYITRNINMENYLDGDITTCTIKLYKNTKNSHSLASAYFKSDEINADILSENQIIAFNDKDNSFLDTNFTLTCEVLGEEETVDKFELCYFTGAGEKIIAESQSGVFNLKMHDLKISNNYYVKVSSAADGKVCKSWFNLSVVKVTEKTPGKVTISDGKIKITVPEDVPLIGGSEISLDGVNAKIVAEYEQGGKFKVGISNNLLEEDKPDFNKLKSLVNEFTVGDNPKYNAKINNDYFDLSPESKKFLIFDDVKFIIGGYGEGTINSNGIANVNINYFMVFKGEGEVERDIVAFSVPLHMELGYGFSVTSNNKIGYDFENNTLSPDANIGIDAEVELAPAIGVGCKYAYIGLYGNVKLYTDIILKNKWASELGIQRAGLEGEVGVKGELGPFEYSFTFINEDWEFYNRFNANTLGSANALKSIQPSNDLSSVFNIENYTLNKDKSTSVYSGNEIEANSLTEIINDCRTNAQPQIISCGGTTLMVYLDKDNSRTDINSNVLMYSLYNESVDKWSQPKKVDNNDLLDNRASLYTDGSDIYLIYEEAGQLLADGASISDFAASLEIVSARFNMQTGEFEDFEKLTSNEVMDSKPVIANAEGTLTAAWVSNSASDYFGLNSENKIMYSVYSENGWSEADVLEENLSCVTDIAVGSLDGKTVVSYILDDDNDLITEDDKKLYIHTLGSNAVSAGKGSLDNLQFAVLPQEKSEVLTWYEDGFVKYTANTAGTGDYAMDGADYSIASDYTITDGKIYYVSRNDCSTNLMLVTYENGWSEPVVIEKTASGSYFEQLTAAGDTVVMVRNKVAVNSDGISEKADIVSYRYSDITDLKVNNAVYDYDYAVPDYQMPLYINVSNNGTRTVNGVSVNVYKGEENVYSKDIAYVIRAGAEEDILILLDTDEIFYTGDYRICVQPLNLQDSDPDDNETVFFCGLSDLEVEVSEFVAGNGGTVTVSVKNNSYVPVSGSELSVEDEYGNVLKTIDVPEVTGGGIEVFNIPVKELLNDNESEKFIHFNLSTDSDEYDVLNNSAIKNIVRYAVSIETCETELDRTEFTYDGNAETPEVTVRDGEKLLSENTDYTVEYSDNVNAGTATATITGIGKYSGSVVKSFEIKPKKVGNLSVSVADEGLVYTGKAVVPEVSVMDGEKTLISGRDYYLVYNKNIDAGTAEVTVVGIGNYTEAITEKFSIGRRNISNGLTYSYTSNYIYTRNAHLPEITVKYGNIALEKGVDYSVSYSNNVNAGKANIIITGLGNYMGTITKTFVISPRSIESLSISNIEEAYIYTGSAITPAAVLKYGTKQLVQNVDYTASYSSNFAIGTASVKITGKGNYTGTLTKSFDIVPKTPSFKEEYTSVTDAVRINWEKIDNATGYRIYRYNEKNKSWDNITTIKDNTVLTYRDEGLKSGTVYRYKVKAYKKVGDVNYWGFASDEKYTATAPDKVTVTKANRSTTSVRIFWEEVSCTGYKVQQYNSSSGEWETLELVPYETAELKISGLKKSTQYKYRVQAYTKVPGSDNKKGEWSDVFTVSTTS